MRAGEGEATQGSGGQPAAEVWGELGAARQNNSVNVESDAVACDGVFNQAERLECPRGEPQRPARCLFERGTVQRKFNVGEFP